MHILYITTVGGTMRFFRSFINKLILEGNSVDIATNMSLSPVPDYYMEWGCRCFQISCTRSPLNKGNFDAIRELQEIVTQTHYDIVHCHTPIAAACTRIACRKARKAGTKIIYTAHGFHFYKGAPLKNWLLFYPVEKLCSYFTDVLITINTEDFAFAKKKFSIRTIEYVPGVGIDVKKFADTKIDIKMKRKEIGVPETAFLLLSVGELNINKNHQIVLKALAHLHDKKIHYLLAGRGDLKSELLLLADKLGISEQFHLLGYRTDINELDKIANVFVLPSIREGLNVSVMEAMASGRPCIVSDIRGNRDLIDNEKGGYLVDPLNENDIVEKIQKMREGNTSFCLYNSIKARRYNVDDINKRLHEIYLFAIKSVENSL